MVAEERRWSQSFVCAEVCDIVNRRSQAGVVRYLAPAVSRRITLQREAMYCEQEFRHLCWSNKYAFCHVTNIAFYVDSIYRTKSCLM